MGTQIDHGSTPLHTGVGHMLNTKRLGARGAVARYALVQPGIAQVCGPDQVFTCRKAVVIDGLSNPITVRSEEHTSELQSLMRISYAVFCWQKNTQQKLTTHATHH